MGMLGKVEAAAPFSLNEAVVISSGPAKMKMHRTHFLERPEAFTDRHSLVATRSCRHTLTAQVDDLLAFLNVEKRHLRATSFLFPSAPDEMVSEEESNLPDILKDSPAIAHKLANSQFHHL